MHSPDISTTELLEFLESKYLQYNHPDFIETDPVKYDYALFGLGIFEKF